MNVIIKINLQVFLFVYLIRQSKSISLPRRARSRTLYRATLAGTVSLPGNDHCEANISAYRKTRTLKKMTQGGKYLVNNTD